MPTPLTQLGARLPVDEIRWIQSVCEPRIPLGPEDAALWEDLHEARGGNRFEELERSIRRAPPNQYLTHLVTGHQGSGKSTELLRLAKELQTPKEGRSFHVVLLDAAKHLSLIDVRLPDLLAAFLPALLEDSLLKVPATKTAAAMWKRLAKAAGEEGLKLAADLTEGVPGLGGALRTIPGFVEKFRMRTQNETPRAIEELSDLFQEVRNTLVKEGIEDLVVVIDNLEKVQRRSLPDDERRTNHHELFLEQLPLLAGLRTHLVITFPLSLHLSQTSARLQLPGTQCVMVPMVRVRQPPNDDPGAVRGPDEEGVAALRRTLGKRVSLGKVFASDAVARSAITWSGGCLRDLLRLVSQASLRRDALPITIEDIEAVAQIEVGNFERVLQGRPFLRALHEVERTGAFPADFDEASRQWLLYELIVVEYDRGTWFDVHPFACATRAYRLAKPAS